METNRRMIAKAITWQTSGLIVMTLIAFILTGSIEAGGSIAIISSVAGFIAFFLHEKLWSAIRWGKAA